MKSHLLLIVGFALSLTGCGEGVPPAPEQESEMQTDSVVNEPTAAEVPRPENVVVPTAAFIEHMHAHAEQLDTINFALADDDLEAATTPAYWLSRHEEVSGVPDEWKPYLTGMREAANAVEEAPDLATARAAAERISKQCQGCHAVAGISTGG